MNAYQKITKCILDEMRQGQIPWVKPWAKMLDGPISHRDGKTYSLLNQILLLNRPGEYLTWKQIQDEGGHVRKGCHSRPILKWGKGKEKIKKDDGTVEEKEYWFPKVYNMFHIDDCEGIEPKFSERMQPQSEVLPQADSVREEYLSRFGAPAFREAKNTEGYTEPDDTVHMPLRIQFKTSEGYYHTLFRHFAASTAHPSRVDRSAEKEVYGSAYDVREDLLDEIAASMVCAFTDMDISKTVEDSASYISRWMAEIEKNPAVFVWAAGRAENVARYILDKPKDKEEQLPPQDSAIINDDQTN